MAKTNKQREVVTDLPLNTVITVVAENMDEIAIKDMTIQEANELLKKKKSYKYKFYQQGFCTMKPKKKN